MSLKNWSTTAASNTSAPPNGAPENTTLLGDLNDIIRQVMADVRTLAASDTIASATTCDIGAKDNTFLTVTGTIAISGFGTVSAGIYKFLIFDDALTLTHNGTSLILPHDGANLKTAAGDIALMLSLGSGNWRCMYYKSACTVVNPTLSGSWVNYGGGALVAGYWKDSDGMVHVQGLIKSGSGEVFTLPSGYRPEGLCYFAQDGDGALAPVTVTTAGVVSMSILGSATNYLTLNGISFRAYN